MSPGATSHIFGTLLGTVGDSTTFLDSLLQFLELGREFWFLSDHPCSEVHMMCVIQWSVGSYNHGLETEYGMYKAAEYLITSELLSS